MEVVLLFKKRAYILTQKTEFSGVNDWNPECWTLTILKRNYVRKLQMCINELKLLRTWNEIKIECVFQITKLSGWHMMILLISSIRYTLLPGEIGILAISHKIFTRIQSITKRRNSNNLRPPQNSPVERSQWLSSGTSGLSSLCEGVKAASPLLGLVCTASSFWSVLGTEISLPILHQNSVNSKEHHLTAPYVRLW